MSKYALAGVAVSFAIASTASADVLYGMDLGDGSIFTLDTSNGSLNKFFGHGVNNFGGLDFDAAGNLYMEQFGQLTKVDLGGGGDTQIGNNGLALESFTILGNKAYSADVFDGNMYSVDLNNASGSLLGSYGDTNTRICDLADDDANRIWGVRIFQQDIIRIDPATGANLGVVASGLPANVTSLAFGSNNNLWFIPAFETTLYSVDLGTGKVSAVLQGLNVSHVTGLTGRVPAPGSAALLAVAGLAATRRRR